jgi:ABC-type multidrug transport system ATPase subunit
VHRYSNILVLHSARYQLTHSLIHSLTYPLHIFIQPKDETLGGNDVENGNGENGTDSGYKEVPDQEASRSSMFTKRKGLGMTWCGLNFDVNDDIKVLNNVSGRVESGEVCAIMGPSGSGKSSLLNVLAGRSASGGGVKITGTVKVGGTKVNPVEYRTQIAYVMQDDALMATTTPREALRFSANLRLTGVSAEEIEEAVEHTLQALDIVECADTFIGSALIKGISGGQRKRTSVGIELITQPSLLFLDEPTSVSDVTVYCLWAIIKSNKK